MQPQPAPRPPKNRLLQDGRDMFWSMAPLIAACIVLAGLVGMCSFQPTGPTVGPAPDYDAPAALQSDAETLGFPVRLPALPSDWHANSGRRDGIEGARTDPATGQRVRALTSRVGYLTPGGMYLSLTQSNADEEALMRSFGTDLVPTGVQDVAGVKWVVYQGDQDSPGYAGGEPVWTTHLGPGAGTQIAITGAGSEADFRTLATATQTQSPLPTTRPTR